MKKQAIKLDKALSLDKETIAKLSEDQLGTLEGGMMQAGTTATCNGSDYDGTSTVCSCSACSCNA